MNAPRAALSLVAALAQAAFFSLPPHVSAETPQPSPAPRQAPQSESPAAAQAQKTPQAWVARSNQHAKILLDVIARLAPEGAGQIGMEGYDDAITDLSLGFQDRAIAANREAAARLTLLLGSESDPQVQQDLQIMIDRAKEAITGIELQRKYSIPYYNVSQAIFGGLRVLLDDQVAPERRKAAVVRLRKYTGTETGSTPFAVLAQQTIRARMTTPRLMWPSKAQVDRGLADSASFLDGIPKLFEKYQISGYDEPFAKLKAQVAAYDDFIRREILPKARADFRLAPELYAFSLRQFGVDIPPGELAKQAHEAFDSIQRDMQALAPVVSKEKGWTFTDYRDVIRELKKDQLVGEAILPHYQGRLKQLEEIIAREKIVTLPSRPARIRLATAAETAASPAPNMRAPRLIGNTGEQGEFLLPLNVPTTDGKTLQTDDFTFAAASWTLTLTKRVLGTSCNSRR
jgi:hypothetical protein